MSKGTITEDGLTIAESSGAITRTIINAADNGYRGPIALDAGVWEFDGRVVGSESEEYTWALGATDDERMVTIQVTDNGGHAPTTRSVLVNGVPIEAEVEWLAVGERAYIGG